MACARPYRNGWRRKLRPDDCCRGCRSPSAPASRCISPPTANQLGGRPSHWRLPRPLSPLPHTDGRSAFRWRLVWRRLSAAFVSSPCTACASPTRCCRSRPGPRSLPASSKPARSARRATALSCACTASTPRALMRSRNGCASRSAKGRRPRLAPMLPSRRICRHRSHRCGPAATILPATCISSRSVRRATCLAIFAPRRRRSKAAPGCATPPSSTPCARRWTGAFAQSFPATAVRSRRH